MKSKKKEIMKVMILITQIIFIIFCFVSIFLTPFFSVRQLLFAYTLGFVVTFIIGYYVILHDSFLFLKITKVKPMFGVGSYSLSEITFQLTKTKSITTMWHSNLPRFYLGAMFPGMFMIHAIGVWENWKLEDVVYLYQIILNFAVFPCCVCYLLTRTKKTVEENEMVVGWIFMVSAFGVVIVAPLAAILAPVLLRVI